MTRLAGKVALVTGGASGIGEGISRTFAAAGCITIIGDVQRERGQAVAESLRASARFVHLDVTDESMWRAAVEGVVLEFGRLDVLVNNAGTSAGVKRIDKEDPADHERLMRLNVTGVWNGIRAVVPAMRRQGSGSIINIASMDSFIGVSGMATYVTSKYAVLGLTKSAALEYGHMGIRVNAIHPGVVRTPLVDSLAPNVLAELNEAVARQPIKRLAEPADIGKAALFFATDDSSYCTGSSLLVDGGHTAGRYRDLID